ncbi:MAG TPA: glycosyltransferase family 2 protein [Rhodothermales bacterium]|nr:glycosyltransferase family 2 protein [Rhodothermales bacterium]
MEPDLSIIVPVFDEEGSLRRLADEIRTACDGAGLSFEAWLVDDGSKDTSWDVIQEIHEMDGRFAGVRFRRNYGKSAALAVGFERARGRYVATLDADLQDDPAELPGMVEMLRDGLDMVSGWKQKRNDPLEKRLPSKFYNAITRKTSGIPLHDFNCGIKAYRRDVVKAVRVYGELHRFIPLLAKWEGYTRIGEKPVVHRAREHGRSKFGIERYIRGYLDLISVGFMTRFAARPMHFFGGIGTLAFFFGVLTLLWLSFDKLVLGHPIGDRPLLFLGMLLILFGAQMFTTGLLGEMIVRPRMERTSAYQVTEAVEPAPVLAA